MKNTFNYRRTVGGITVLSGILAAASIVMGAHAVDYNFEAFSEPTLVLQYAHHAQQAYWFLLLDMAGYYLLLLPVIFYLHQQYKYHSPWVPLFTFSGIAYVLVGAIGAALLAAAWPLLMQQYLAASSVQQDNIIPLFSVITQVVTKGLWNILEVLFSTTWWIGFGLLMRKDHKAIAVLSIVAGVGCLLDSAGTMLGIKFLSEAGVNVYLVCGIFWPLIVGIRLFRNSSSQTPGSTVESGATASKAMGFAKA